VKAAGTVAGLAAALVFQAALARLAVGQFVPCDLVLVAVVYAALVQGPVAGMLAGTGGGLVQDALSAAVVGVGGFAKTLAGFAAGVLGAHVIVTAPLVRFAVFAAATVVHGLVFYGAYALIDPRALGVPFAALGVQALGNALIGTVAFEVAARAPRVWSRRRRRPRR
jgi:rod shape-determining protein MreD